MTGDLPLGWAWARFGDIADTQLGKMLSAKSRQGLAPMPYLRNQNVQWHRIDLSDVASMDFTDDERAKYQLQPGDLLICEGGEVGRSARWTQPSIEMCFQKALHRVRPRPGIETGWIEFFMRWAAETGRFGDRVQGSTIAHLPQRDLRALEVPIPPSAEQRRIIAAVEEHFSRLDAVQGALELACWRLEALATALLSESIRHSPESTSDWRIRPLSDVLDHTIGGVWGSAPGEQEIDVDVIRVTELRSHGGLDISTAARRSITNRQLKTRQLQPGDLVLEKSGGGPTRPVGRVAQFRGHEREAICTNFMQMLRPNRDEIDSNYLHFVLHQRYVSGETVAMNKGSGNIRNIDTSAYLNQHLLVPPLAIQRQVASDLGQMLQTVVRLEQSVAHAQPRLEALRRAVLAAAFSGQLVR